MKGCRKLDKERMLYYFRHERTLEPTKAVGFFEYFVKTVSPDLSPLCGCHPEGLEGVGKKTVVVTLKAFGLNHPQSLLTIRASPTRRETTPLALRFNLFF